MVNLVEDTIKLEDAEVYFQDPEDLKIEVSDRKVVVHDDNPDQEDDNNFPELPGLDSPNDDTTVDINIENDDSIHSMSDDMINHAPENLTPMDALMKVKSDPKNISIAKYGDNYYIDHHDLKCFMDACGKIRYEDALNSVIDAHSDSDINSNNIRVIMGKNDLSILTPTEKDMMEESSVSFEIY